MSFFSPKPVLPPPSECGIILLAVIAGIFYHHPTGQHLSNCVDAFSMPSFSPLYQHCFGSGAMFSPGECSCLLAFLLASNLSAFSRQRLILKPSYNGISLPYPSVNIQWLPLASRVKLKFFCLPRAHHDWTLINLPHLFSNSLPTCSHCSTQSELSWDLGPLTQWTI